jgi:hypothetical protein
MVPLSPDLPSGSTHFFHPSGRRDERMMFVI